MRNRWAVLVMGGLLAAGAKAQDQASSLFKVNFPNDSPLTVLKADWGESRTEARGGALVLDLHTALVLRNSTQRRIRAVTLLIQAQAVTAGGKGSVAVASLDVHPGETFAVPVDLRLLRPLLAGGGPMAEISLDGVLFDDLSFYGPNRLNSQRTMLAWELEARRDRRYLKSVLEAKGPQGLQQEILGVLDRAAQRPSLDVQLLRQGRATAVAAQERERQCQFAFLNIPDAPLEPLSGLARVAGSEARAPRIQVLNRSGRPIRYFEIGWLIRDREGREYLAGSVPASESGVSLAPGARGEVSEQAALKFSNRAGQPVQIDGMTGYVSQVQFADGSMWIPGRTALDNPRLRSVLTPSPEEQRLANLYRRKGLAALVNELRRF